MPDSFEIYSKRVDKTEGYDVQYNITKSWDTGVEGNIVITNNSDAPIEAWTLSFDSNFTINNLWNGRVLENNETSYKIAAEMWTNPVQPNGSMTIGFVGSKAADVEALLSNFRLTEVIIGEGTPVTPIDPPEEKIEITANAEYNEETDNVTVSWITNNPDGTFDILMSADGENFTSVGTVENVSEFVYTPATDFDAYHFKVVQTVGEQTAESNVVSVVKSAEDIAISAEAVYDDESGSITVKWTTNKPNGTFDVLMSFDGESFTSVGTVENVAEFVYTPDEFDTLYFKVKQTAGAKTAESNVVSVVYTVDWSDKTDTDNDGLPDVYEKQYFETDPENADTDGDGLPDGYEVYYLGTDPKKADSDDNGVPDSDEDFDKDGLNNLREYELGTDPNNADSDSDGLSDSDEVNTYNTDPLKYDTDADGISDGDEIALGLDPNSASTDGVPDSERTFVQHIGADSENLAAVNTDENPFKVSIDITAAGVAANNLVSHESGYSNAIRNDAILGITPEFIYTDGLKVEDVVINFDISESAAANTNGKYTSLSDEFVGIKRLNVFKFFEDTNMLLPIETFHDVENNRVYTHVDELGTYCLMDMEVWLESIGIEAVGSEYNEAEVNRNEAASSELNTRPADIVFLMQKTGNAEGRAHYAMSNAAQYSADLIFKKMPNARIAMIISDYKESFYATTSSGSQWAENSEDVRRMLWQAQYKDSSTYTRMADVASKVRGIPDYRDGVQRFVVFFRWSTYSGNSDQLNTDPMYNYSVVNYGYWHFNKTGRPSVPDREYDKIKIAEFESYGGRFINGYLDSKLMAEEVAKHITTFRAELPEEYTIIKATSLEKLPADFGKIYPSGTADYDKDGLKDSEEIDFELIRYENGNYKLPTFGECRAMVGEKLFYVQAGLSRFGEDYAFMYMPNLEAKINETVVLPIKSDPTAVDSDQDGYLDSILNSKLLNKDDCYTDIADPYPLYNDVYEYSLKPDYVRVDGFNIDYHSYGGNQGTFLPECKLVEGLDETDEKIARKGCGFIAFSDILLYISNNHPDYAGLSELKYSDDSYISFVAYRDFVRENYNDYYEKYIIDDVTIPQTFETFFNLRFQNNSYSLTAKYESIGIFSKYKMDSYRINISKNSIQNLIVNSLKNDMPVFLAVDALTHIENYSYSEKYYGDNYYKLKPTECLKGRRYDDIQSHALVITGLIYDGVKNKSYLIMSNYGEKCIVDFDNFIEASQNSWGTGLILIS